ncbi:methyltransferase domain-containing protein [Streptomyces sp. NPDC053493]|uniref:methyltransferase domain-containing protein n=1 Tax=Streptomyces sp. NPDC053493 TaxID=3365705 RepID=UPI0037D25FF5
MAIVGRPAGGAEDELVQGMLDAIAEQLGGPLPAGLVEAFRRVRRHRFLPERIWLRNGEGGYAPLDRRDEPERWLAAAYSDAPLVTQFTSGLPSSSASMPSMVARTLLLTGLGDRPAGQGAAAPRVLELGAGTGFNAALLCALVGDENVATIELDPVLATQAEENLKAAGYAPAVIRGDAADGWATGGPYDAVLATFSVDHVPSAWLTQVRPGGWIVTPWTSAWCRYGTLRLTAGQGGGAEGRFHSFASFMPMTSPATREPATAGAAPDSPAADTRSSTTLSPWAVAGGDLDAEFHIGLAVPGASFFWDTSGEHTHTRLEIGDDTTSSWATVDYDGRTATEFAVTQSGPRALWDEITAAYARWEQLLGRPDVGRYGLTVRAGGAATVWLDSPTTVVAAR